MQYGHTMLISSSLYFIKALCYVLEASSVLSSAACMMEDKDVLTEQQRRYANIAEAWNHVAQRGRWYDSKGQR